MKEMKQYLATFAKKMKNLKIWSTENSIRTALLSKLVKSILTVSR